MELRPAQRKDGSRQRPEEQVVREVEQLQVGAQHVVVLRERVRVGLLVRVQPAAARLHVVAGAARSDGGRDRCEGLAGWTSNVAERSGFGF